MKKIMKRVMLIALAVIMLPIQNMVAFAGTSGESGLFKYTIYGDSIKWVGITGYTEWISGDLVIPSLINGVAVERIEAGAFANCHGITSVSIPSGVAIIEENAFSGCTNMTDIVLRDGNANSTVTIGERAFSACSYLKSITLPRKISYSIRDLAFSGCDRLTDIYFTGTKEQYDTCSINVYDYNEDFENAEVYYVDSVRTISLNKTSMSLVEDNSERLIATITPSDATNKTILWSSSNTSVAAVSADGTVNAINAGTATITATSQDKNKVATCVVTVTEKAEEDILGGGDGTASNPYVIDSEEKLQIVSDIPNAYYVLSNDITLTGKFTPLCALDSEFSGVFDGNGYTISNLTISDYYEYSGLFGKNSGTIKNLNVVYSTDGAKYEFLDSTNFGGITGYNNGDIINCTVNLSAEITDLTSSGYIITVGGVTGNNTGNGNVKKCDVDGEIVVAVKSDGEVVKSTYIGGISGLNHNSINNCNVNISITENVENGAVSVNSYIGGISASSEGTIKNSNAIYDINIGQAPIAYIGGVIGTGNNFTIENVSTDGKISSTANSVYAGGILGNDLSSNKSSITKTNAKITAEVTEIFGSVFMGGIAGYLKPSSSISESCATIDFDAKKSADYAAHPYLHCGGLAGTTSGQINNCFAIGGVTTNIITTSIESGGLVGGISGASPDINNSYASVSGVKYGLAYPGGTVTNSFYDSGVSGCSDTGYGSPTSTISMKMKSIYTNAGWDFNNVWNISSSINNGYPHLRALTNSSVVNVTGLSLDKSQLTMNIGESETVTATVSPSNATNKTILWSSSNANIVTVSNGTVTAVSAGKATITVKTEDGNFIDTCSVVVNAPTVQKVSTPDANIVSGNIDKGTSVTLSTETEGATIYYTTDGSTPTTSSLIYTQAITINDATTIKAYAVKNGMEDSSVATFTYSVIEDDKTTVSISDKKGKPGDTITLTLDISNNPGIAGMILRLSYDEGLTLTNIATGDALSGLTFTPPANVSKNPCTLLWDGITADNTNGTVLTLTFKISDTASEGEYKVNVTYTSGDIYDDDTNDIDVQIVNGAVTVRNYKTGDANGDDVINAKDITILRKHISGDYGVTAIEDAADVNKDGVLNAKDITILRKFISGDYGIVLD